MLEIFLITCAVIILVAIFKICDDFRLEKDRIKRSVESDYKLLISYCKRDQNVLRWVTTLNRRFEAFMKSNEYQVRKPYDKFKLIIPSKHYSGLLVFIAIDKKLNPKFVVNFEPSQYDGGRSEKYLKYCFGFGKEMCDFIKKCEDTVMNENLEKERIKTVEKMING